METKVTKREMFEVIKAMVSGDNFDTEVTEDMIAAFCDKEIAALDAKAAKAKENAAKKKAEGDALTDAVLAALSEDFEPIADILARVDAEDATLGKVSYRLNQLSKAGKAEKATLEIPGGEGKKKRQVVGFKIAGLNRYEEG